MEFVFFAAFFFIVIIPILVSYITAKRTLRSQRLRIDSLETNLSSLRKSLQQLKSKTTVESKETELKTAAALAVKEHPWIGEAETAAKEEFIPAEKEKPRTAPAKKIVQAVSTPKVQQQEDPGIIERLETYFAAEITGIAGTFAIILGVIFLGIYAAISMGPFGRFLLVCGASAGLYVVHEFLKRKKVWYDIALWLRSAAGVIFLIGCLASCSVPAMRWIDTEAQGWGLILIGITVNLSFGFLNKTQIFAGLHTVLSLIALLFIPFTFVCFLLASVIVMVGLTASYREKKWDIYICTISIAYTFAHFYWILNDKSFWPESQIIPIITCLIVGITALGNHYRKLYHSNEDGAKNAIIRFIIWLTLGLNLLPHTTGSWLSTAGLMAGMILSFGFSSYALHNGVKWLFNCDRTVSLAMLLLACFSLERYDISAMEILLLSTPLSLIFFKLTSEAREKFIFNLTMGVVLILYTILFVEFIDRSVESTEIFWFTANFAVLALLFPSIETLAKQEKFGLELEIGQEKENTSLLPIAFGVFLPLSLSIVSNYHSTGINLFLLPAGIMIYAVLFKKRLQNLITDFCVLIGLGISVIYGCFEISSIDVIFVEKIAVFTILLAPVLIALRFSFSKQANQCITWPPLVMLWLLLMVGAYEFFFFDNPALPGILWLLIFLVIAEAKELPIATPTEPKAHNRSNVTLYRLGLLTFGCFIVRFFLVDMTNESVLFGLFKLRLFSECFALATLFYWTLLEKPGKDKPTGMLFDAFMALGIVFVVYETTIQQQALIWALMPFLCTFVTMQSRKYSRILLYGYGFYFASLFYIAFLVMPSATTSRGASDINFALSIISAVAAGIFLFITHKKTDIKNTVLIPQGMNFLESFRNLMDRAELKAMLYPLLLSVAIFLYWNFDRTVLSLFWFVECFILFILSLTMRQPDFRSVSMSCIVLICIRVILYDLQGQDFLLKAIVFLCIGTLLVLMNIIYNRYKYRYDSEQTNG